MNENIEKLNNWYNSISHFEKLKYDEVLMLLNEYKEEKDEKKKEVIRERIILGTLYIIYNFISKSEFMNLKSDSYDIDDVISSSIEVWINILFTERPFEVTGYSYLFRFKFYYEVINKLIGQRHRIFNITKVNANNLSSVLLNYCELKNGNYNFNFDMFVTHIGCKLYDQEDKEFYSKCANLYNILDSMYNCNLNVEKISNSSFRAINLIQYLLVNNGYEYSKPLLEDIAVDDFIEEIELNILTNQIYKDIIIPLFDLAKISPLEREILAYRFGFKTKEGMTFDAIGKKYGKEGNYISVIYSRAFNKIRTQLYRNGIDVDEVSCIDFIDKGLYKTLERKRRK